MGWLGRHGHLNKHMFAADMMTYAGVLVLYTIVVTKTQGYTVWALFSLMPVQLGVLYHRYICEKYINREDREALDKKAADRNWFTE